MSLTYESEALYYSDVIIENMFCDWLYLNKIPTVESTITNFVMRRKYVQNELDHFYKFIVFVKIMV